MSNIHDQLIYIPSSINTLLGANNGSRALIHNPHEAVEVVVIKDNLEKDAKVLNLFCKVRIANKAAFWYGLEMF